MKKIIKIKKIYEKNIECSYFGNIYLLQYSALIYNNEQKIHKTN